MKGKFCEAELEEGVTLCPACGSENAPQEIVEEPVLKEEEIVDPIQVEEEPAITPDELLTMVEEVEQEGGMNADESELLKSAIEFHDMDVNDILTPRVKVEGVPLDATVYETADRFE